MPEKTMNEATVKRTQDTLGKIIGKKPPLTEKLLNRPPFRFLHDIITSVIKQTGFMKGLFTEKEGQAESISSKEEKIAFLQKAIDITVYATGAKLSVRPSKIVAGLEAEKTNEFLQAIAAAVEKKPDNDECVKKVTSGGTDSPSSRPSKESKSSSKDKESSRDRERESSSDKRKRRSEKEKSESKRSSKSSSSKDNKENKDHTDKKDEKREDRKEDRRDKDRESRRHRDSSKDGRRESSRNRESSKDRDRDRRDKDRDSDRDREKRERSGRHRRKEEEPQVNGVKDEPTEKEAEAPSSGKNNSEPNKDEESQQETDDEKTANRIPRPSSAKGSRRRHKEGRRAARDDDEDDDDGKHTAGDQDDTAAIPPQVEQTRRLARPASARPAPPKIKRQEGVTDSLTERVDSARTQRVDNVIVDNAMHSEDEDEGFTVEEGQGEPMVAEREETVAPADDDGQHGGLVKKILESKKEYAQSEQNQQNQTKTKIDKSSVNDATRHKEKEMVRKEVEKLRTSIQTLTRSANPLGKIMDYVQEDIHSMQKERDMWRKENRKLSDEIKSEMSVTDGSIEPLKAKLAELEQAVADQLDSIAAVKHSIIENDEKITKMLSSVTRT